MFAVDVGNTRIKIGFFPPSYFRQSSRAGFTDISFTDRDSLDLLKDFVEQLPEINEPQSWYIAKTGKFSWEVLQEQIAALRPKDKFIFISYTDIPLEIDVENPAAVGLDRLLAVYAASLWRKEYEETFAEGTPVLVADAGTALTIDLLTAEGHFGGGAIFPGLHSLAEALAGISPRIPKIEIHRSNSVSFPAKNTENACITGVIGGTIGVIMNFYEDIKRQSAATDIPLLLTGGDADILIPIQKTLKAVYYNQRLVLSGIAAIAEKSIIPCRDADNS